MLSRWQPWECGNGALNAVVSIQESIDGTLRFRFDAGLDHRYVVLGDKGEAGVAILNTFSEPGVAVWIDRHAGGRLDARAAPAGK